MDAASRAAHLFAPCSWYDFEDFAKLLVQVGTFPKRKDRTTEHDLDGDLAAGWPQVQAGVIDSVHINKFVDEQAYRVGTAGTGRW